MAKPLESGTVSAPGFYGLNTQDSSVGLEDGFATVANNAVIDKYGRIGSRKGWTIVNTAGAAIGANDVKAIHEHFGPTGTQYILVAASTKLYKLASGTLTELTYGGGGSAPTITDSNWEIVSLNGIAYFFQLGHDPLYFDPATSTTVYKRVTEHGSYSATIPSANIAISAYGRLWVAGTSTNKVTVSWSDQLLGYVWGTGTSGSLNLTTVFTNGMDEIVGIEAINGLLVIFCKKCIIIYENAMTPSASTFILREVIKNVGCLARDSIQNTGNDILFLSATGVQSLSRLQQNDTALPLKDVSRNVRDDLLEYVTGTTDKNTIKSVYHPYEALYVLSFPASDTSYVFDTRAVLENGASRATTWALAPTAFCSTSDNTLLMGMTSYVGLYTGSTDNTASFRLQYFTNYKDLKLPTIIKILKRIGFTIKGPSGQAVVIKWGFDYNVSYKSISKTLDATGSAAYFNIAEFNEAISEYNGGDVLTRIRVPASGSGLVLQLGIETDISESQVSIQAMDIYIKQGKQI